MLLSNELIALYVSREECPTESKNNQFFVYEFPELKGTIDPQIQQKLLDRLGNYIRTELKSVFDSLNMDGFRYSIDVTITDAETELFSNNVTDLEADTDIYIQKLADYYGPDPIYDDGSYSEFIKENYLPIDFFKHFSLTRQHYNRIVKNMRRRNLLIGDLQRMQFGGERFYCIKMTDKLTEMINCPATIGIIK